MTARVLLAYSGGLASSAAAAWLAERHGAEVVTVTLDVGQSDDLDEVRARALTCGAVRAHVIDARDLFARDHVIPAVRASGSVALSTLAHPLVARTLVEIAAIESADAVAHGSAGAVIDDVVATLDPALRILAPARTWGMTAAALLDYARARHLPAGPSREPHLLIRRSQDPGRAPASEAVLTIDCERGVPVSVNGVALTLVELIESLSLIGGQHGIGYGEAMPAPAAVLLRAGYAATAASDWTVRLKLHDGACTLLTAAAPQLVNHP
jgi:argininosuccinate synthase